ncbi:hypothetical protein HDV02_000736 [Globomyces sp. JEL0801]|nr:hypothetical protein HDV02_000736 [Globomyces sp. JEL0801]
MQSHHSSFSSNRKEHNSLWDLAASEIVTKVTKKDNNNLMADENLAIQRNFKAGVKSTIPAVLSVKIKKLSIDKEKLSQVRFILLIVKRIPKGSATFNQVKHFAVNIVDNRSHPHNLVRIDIVGVGRENKEYDIGAILFHLHDIIKGSPSSGEYGINGQHTIVGFVSMEITSNYGSFGYGYSNQYYEINDRASRLTALHNHLQQNQQVIQSILTLAQRSENVPVKPDDIQDVEYPSTSYIKYLQPLSAIQEPVYEHSTYRNTMAGKLTLTPQFKIIHSVEDPSPLD